MNTIQKKIWVMTSIVIVIMACLWVLQSHYNRQTQLQYNTILQRYLGMIEVTASSQDMITALNLFLAEPNDANKYRIGRSQERLIQAKQDVSSYINHVNGTTFINYLNLIDSLIDTSEQLRIFHSIQMTDEAEKKFSEATSIANYISEMTLTLIDFELKTYEEFYKGIINQSKELNQFGIWLLLLITFVSLTATYWFSQSITRPVQQLTEAANELSKGNFEQEINVDTKDEIAFLAKTFNRMRLNIKNLIQEIKEKAHLEHELQKSKLLLKEIQFQSLQNQINPHFLFNTLNALSKKAYLEGSEETGDLLVNVAGLLRYNLKRIDRAVTLQEEVSVLKQYIDIQKARFPDRLHVHFDIDESLLSVPIPALTLQPIIENAVIHAVEPREEGGIIHFRIKEEKEMVRIEISDDGPGIPREKIEQILKGELQSREGHSTGLGFSNVVQRLKLFYGYDDVIEIESKEGHGTKVVIKIKKG